MQAVAAHRIALEELPRDLVPLHWARAQHNLGATLHILGRITGHNGLLGQAAAAYRSALQERTRERVPFERGQTKNNLDNVLALLRDQRSKLSVD